MRGLQKSKRVSWASDLNLCQVKLFLSDESPSQVGLGGQDHLQAKAPWPWHSAGTGSDDNLPPGFEGVQPANLLQNKLSQVPLIQWKCPSRFALDPNWQVAAGEESKELEVESQREMRVLEAVYPRPSAIPPNPASPVITDDPYYDHHTPLIPITPIEDEDIAPDSSSTPANTSSPAPATMASQSSNGGAVEPDVVSAAYSALNAAMSNGTQGSLIDPNLLIKILSNPSLIEKLVSSTQGPSTSGPQISQPLSMPTSPAISVAEPPPPPPVHARTTHLPFSTASSSSGNAHYPPPSRVGPGPGPVSVSVSNLPPPPTPPEKKDINYYKSLIQQHGGEKAEAMNSNHNNSSNNNLNNNNNNVVKTRGDTKGKVMKPCIYYNSARGCRHGANCVFQHDSSSSLSQQQQQQQQRVGSSSGLPDSKRMKMDSREISGT